MQIDKKNSFLVFSVLVKEFNSPSLIVLQGAVTAVGSQLINQAN